MATVEMTGRTVNITPKARILKVLSRIEFDPWQCVAELVDNSFDEFIDIKRSGIAWNEPYEVSVSLPTAMTADATVVISDNGRGMSIDRVKDAVSAGFSGNDPTSKLGLFGMGFNVATARIGSVTRFLTSRAGEADWLGGSPPSKPRVSRRGLRRRSTTFTGTQPKPPPPSRPCWRSRRLREPCSPSQKASMNCWTRNGTPSFSPSVPHWRRSTNDAGRRLLEFLGSQRRADTTSGAWRSGVEYAEECIANSLPAIEAEAYTQGYSAGRLDKLDGHAIAQQERARLLAALPEAIQRRFGGPLKGAKAVAAAIAAELPE